MLRTILSVENQRKTISVFFQNDCNVSKLTNITDTTSTSEEPLYVNLQTYQTTASKDREAGASSSKGRGTASDERVRSVADDRLSTGDEGSIGDRRNSLEDDVSLRSVSPTHTDG